MNVNKFILLIMVVIAMVIKPAKAVKYSTSFALGYTNGTGLQVNGMISDLSSNFPFKMRMGLGYTMISNPGKALDARKIFINNATNGRPEKKGWSWNFKFDLLYSVHWFKLSNAYFYAGPRYVKFTGNFNFVNGNEDFDITSKHWGVGIGLLSSFPINKKLDLYVDGGLDYYFPSTLYGHDTSYSPDNENVNPRENFTYKDADAAINQPKFVLNLLMGLRFYF